MFGEPDVAMGAPNDPGSLRVWLGPTDAPGVLWRRYGRSNEDVGRVLDLCVREEAYARIGGRTLAPGESISGQDLLDIRYFQLGANCHGNEPGEPHSRYFYLSTNGISPFYDTPEQAQQWRQDLRDFYQDTLPRGAYPYGVRIEASGLGILYADVDDPIDEVRVLADSVNVRDGALRGAVRNWSRHLWAYSVVVRADGREWAWPLSVQPGEAAPFEFEDWDGPTDPAQIQISVTAHMSPKVDISRSIQMNWLPTQYEFLSVSETQRFLGFRNQDSEFVADMAHLNDLYLARMSVEFQPAMSHPSFADDTVYNEFERPVSELRAFYAYTEPITAAHVSETRLGYDQTKIHDVVELTIHVQEFLKDEDGNDLKDAYGGYVSRMVTITDLPHTHPGGRADDSALLAMAGSHAVGKIVWIGSEQSNILASPSLAE